MSKAIKVVLLIGALMFVVFGIAAYGLISRFTSDTASIDQRNRERLAEVERIRALPELRGVWVHTGTFSAPFSGDEVAACLLLKNRKINYSGPARGHSTSRLPPYTEEDNVAVVHGTNMLLAINGVTYPFSPDSLILSYAEGHRGKGGDHILSAHGHPQEVLRTLPVQAGLLSAHLDASLGGRGPDIRLEEILFAPGDSIGFYGRIENGNIVPLF
jgi:hypothetical protein